MEIKDLRLGNLVWYKNYPTEHFLRIDNKKMSFFLEDEESFNRFIEPIPLTEEWLLKFGFEKISDYWFNKGENELEWYSGIKVFVYRLKYSANRSFPVREIKYVHQLQNLYFALTGEELQLK